MVSGRLTCEVGCAVMAPPWLRSWRVLKFLTSQLLNAAFPKDAHLAHGGFSPLNADALVRPKRTAAEQALEPERRLLLKCHTHS